MRLLRWLGEIAGVDSVFRYDYGRCARCLVEGRPDEAASPIRQVAP